MEGEDDDDGDDDSIEYEVFFESKKIKETLQLQQVNHFNDLVQKRNEIVNRRDPFEEHRETYMPIELFAPKPPEPPEETKKGKGKRGNKNARDNSSDKDKHSHSHDESRVKSPEPIVDQKITKIDPEINKLMHKKEQDELKNEIESLMADMALNGKPGSSKGSKSSHKHSHSNKSDSAKK